MEFSLKVIAKPSGQVVFLVKSGIWLHKKWLHRLRIVRGSLKEGPNFCRSVFSSAFCHLLLAVSSPGGQCLPLPEKSSQFEFCLISCDPSWWHRQLPNVVMLQLPTDLPCCSTFYSASILQQNSLQTQSLVWRGQQTSHLWSTIGVSFTSCCQVTSP